MPKTRTPQPHHAEATAEKLQALCDWLHRTAKAHYDVHLTNLTAPTFRFTDGPKNIKILVQENGKDRSVWGFVERSSGCIMRAAGYKAPDPARHERGNIHLPDGWSNEINYIGPNYR